MKAILLLALLLLSSGIFAQTPKVPLFLDSLASQNLSEVVVTATRTSQLLADVPVPITLIPAKQIEQAGSLRLHDILAEQTGLNIVNELGQGIQMQGLDPDYTLILLDGEPIAGRNGGTLDLSRIAVGNIKQIEVVKGPSSSLYGSEALAGVVNIITENPNGKSGTITARYGTNQNYDISGKVSFQEGETGFYLFANRFGSGGYDFNPEEFGQTVNPFVNHTLQGKITHDLSDQTSITVSGRYFHENQENQFAISNGQRFIEGKGTVSDWNFNPVITHKIGGKWKLDGRFYTTRYRTNSPLFDTSDGALYDESFFRQGFTRPEIQTAFYLNDNHVFTAGSGTTFENVEATRYDGRQSFQTIYVFGQHEWTISDKLNIVSGFRFDRHNVFGQQFSPKLSFKYDALPWLSVRGSAGMGFKAPDFRQLALNFSNAISGYEVFGVLELEEGLQRLEENDLISELLIDPNRIGELEAERSRSINLGMDIELPHGSKLAINGFHNDVENLIETQAVARKTNGQQVFSYLNLDAVSTYGIEADFSYPLNRNLKFMTGYQWLQTLDKAVIDEIEAGEVFRRDPVTLQTRRVNRQDYGGLFNRSAHMWNARLFYEDDKGWSGSFRSVYRGRFGFGDRNGNQILDTDNEYVDGYFMFNATLAKHINKFLKLQVGCDNLLNFRDENFLPMVPGRLLWATATLNF